MSESQEQPKRTNKAITACATWLAYCVEIGWSKEQVPGLEKVWWEHHDERGNLVAHKEPEVEGPQAPIPDGTGGWTNNRSYQQTVTSDRTEEPAVKAGELVEKAMNDTWVASRSKQTFESFKKEWIATNIKLKKERDYTKFYTYPETADRMVKLAGIGDLEKVLEPSAGNGTIIRAIRKVNTDCEIHAIEINPFTATDLSIAGANKIFIDDFLNAKLDLYDVVIANPPFGNGVDLTAHIKKMQGALVPGGRLITIIPNDFGLLTETRIPLENWSTNSDGTKTEISIAIWVAPSQKQEALTDEEIKKKAKEIHSNTQYFENEIMKALVEMGKFARRRLGK